MQLLSMYPGLTSHSPMLAQYSQSRFLSVHGGGGGEGGEGGESGGEGGESGGDGGSGDGGGNMHVSQLTMQLLSMYLGLTSHSPMLAQNSQLLCLLIHGGGGGEGGEGSEGGEGGEDGCDG